MSLISDFKDIHVQKYENEVKISFKSDIYFKRLRLLVILSPIFIACFDNSKKELEFFRNSIRNSDYTYGLYSYFFEGFDYDSYRKLASKTDDIYIDDNKTIYFTINFLKDNYLLGLLRLINNLIMDNENRDYLLAYFAEIRNDIVINGRRSILANGIQAFYLNKYILVWMIDLCEFVKEKNPGDFEDLIDILNLTTNLKTPGIS